MTSLEMEQEMIALRALLKEATVHGVHDQQCEVFNYMPPDFEEVHLEESEGYCNCWMFYASKVVVEAELAEQDKTKIPVVRECACRHSSTYHAGGDGSGFCMRTNCGCSLFTASIPAEAR